ncbi:hypothetical protein PR002_g6869 [Phytophthora rubi]|uniref:ARS-binding protein 1 N-terminal domain-containing protein n=1 Tax=Phytophthora rubi TaxID=129364 RepID=A0A6A3MUQ5_9STRA|nr:hypothetical protein PR002_g6869 [Phytophthora rubi]
MRVHLTKQQQLDLCKHRRKLQPHPSLQELATWAQTTFKLKRPPSKAMVSRVLRQEEVLQTLTPDELKRRNSTWRAWTRCWWTPSPSSRPATSRSTAG